MNFDLHVADEKLLQLLREIDEWCAQQLSGGDYIPLVAEKGDYLPHPEDQDGHPPRAVLDPERRPHANSRRALTFVRAHADGGRQQGLVHEPPRGRHPGGHRPRGPRRPEGARCFPFIRGDPRRMNNGPGMIDRLCTQQVYGAAHVVQRGVR